MDFVMIVGIVLLTIICLLAIFLYTPLPDNAREPWNQRYTFAIAKIINLVCLIGEKIGYDNRLNIRRRVQERMALRRKEKDKESLKVTDTIFNGVKVRIYRPTSTTQKSPALVFIHGGGWVFGSINTHDTVTRRIALAANLVVISVEYRLAPEHLFPAAFDDCVTATTFLQEHASTYGIDASRIAITGDSAGGNLAMSVCLKLSKDRNVQIPKIKIMGLIYPVLQAFDFNLPSYRQFSGATFPSLITKLGMVSVYNIYGFGNIDHIEDFQANKHITTSTKKSEVSERVNTDLLPRKMQSNSATSSTEYYTNDLASKLSDVILNPYFSPLLATDEQLKQLPKTFLLTVEYDPLRDEGWILARRLEILKHDVTHKHWDGIGHGFINFILCESSNHFVSQFANYLKSNI